MNAISVRKPFPPFVPYNDILKPSITIHNRKPKERAPTYAKYAKKNTHNHIHFNATSK